MYAAQGILRSAYPLQKIADPVELKRLLIRIACFLLVVDKRIQIVDGLGVGHVR
jgi:hypothetical protein